MDWKAKKDLPPGMIYLFPILGSLCMLIPLQENKAAKAHSL